ncbi:hypothetical protein C815_01939 [Firmicutes bacterium M10-2]|nr:hypothetical protein C815_01939 [Firmicutes bacterium M10-2]
MRIDQQLLNILIENISTPLPAKKLSFMLGISEKTTMKYMTILKESLQGNGAVIITKQRVGSYLAITDSQLFSAFLAKNTNGIDDPLLRKKYVLTRLMLTDSYINIYDLADELSVSPSLLRATIKDLNPILEQYDLKMKHSHFHGYRIIGNESGIRKCLTFECKESNYIKKAFVDMQLTQIDQNQIRETIASTLKHFNISVSNDSIQSLTLHILVAMNRIETQNPIVLENDQVVLSIKSRIEYQAAKKICRQIENQSGFRFPDNEIAYLTMHISGQQRLYSHEHISVSINDQAMIFYNKFLRNIIRYTNEDFFYDDELRTSLINHIVPFLNRFENNMQIERSALNNIKDEFPYAYDLAVSGLSMPELGKYHITEAENSYFALHLQLAMEKRKYEEKLKYNILVYSKEASSIFSMMSYKFNSHFGDQISEIIFASIEEKEKYDENDFDLVFKTVESFEDPSKRAVMISPFMNAQDIKTIKAAFDKIQSVILDTIMLREYLFFDLASKTKEETIQKMILKTEQYFPLPSDFYEQVIEREIKASTEFEGKIAIPHPMSTTDVPEFIAIARLEKPILWKRRQVQLVFLMCSSQTTNPMIYRKLSTIIKKPELTQTLLEAESFEEFKKVFDTI